MTEIALFVGGLLFWLSVFGTVALLVHAGRTGVIGRGRRSHTPTSWHQRPRPSVAVRDERAALAACHPRGDVTALPRKRGATTP